MDDFIYTDSDNETNALHIACSSDSPIRDQVIILLVRLSANINHPAKVDKITNMTALHLATINQYHSTIEVLLNLGADVDLHDSRKLTPYCYAIAAMSPSIELLGCFRGDFCSLGKIVKLKRHHKKQRNTNTHEKSIDSSNSNSSSTTNGNSKTVDRDDRVDCKKPHCKRDSTKSIEEMEHRRASDEPEFLHEVPSTPISRASDVSTTTPIPTLLPKLRWKKNSGKYAHLNKPVEKLVKYSLRDEAPGFIVYLKDTSKKDTLRRVRVTMDDLLKHDPDKLGKYIRHLCRIGGEKWQRCKEAFGAKKVKSLLRIDSSRPSLKSK